MLNKSSSRLGKPWVTAPKFQRKESPMHGLLVISSVVLMALVPCVVQVRAGTAAETHWE